MPRPPRSPRSALASRCYVKARSRAAAARRRGGSAPRGSDRAAGVPPAGRRERASCGTARRLAARLEFWRFGDDVVEAPNDNALTRRLTATDDLTFTEVERYGRTWRTISGMFDAQPDEFTHDVDLVFSWVDGSASDFQRQRAAQMAEYVVGDGDDGPGALPPCRRASLRPPQRPHVRPVGASHLHRHRFTGADVAARASQDHDRPQRGVLRRSLGAADAQLARRRGAAAPHPRARRALPLLQRRHVLRPPRRAGALLHRRRGVEVRRVRGAHRRRRPRAPRGAATTTGCG